ncbi:DedA family protein [Anaerorhabdus sp.]|uniref:DedA family protein n=1 Tax=Anaerorhabdus sp. TaxID=1872524 RepID=UPI002B206313|nr:DedA family protein [Anaerorhabdus sp.]MEA4876115.1 DedA family protein [Anaerorhabdus sp.]
MNAWLLSILNSFGYLGIAFLIAVENIFPPIPSEVILTFSGFLTTKSDLTPVGVVIAATIGALIGAIILYYFGTIFSEERIVQFMESKWGHWLGFKKADLDKTLNWFQKKGKYGALIGRCVPVIRSIISIPAGMAKMPMGEFVLFTTIGTLAWNILLVFLGVQLGANWEEVMTFFDTYTNIMVIILALVGLYIVYWWFKRKRKQG